MSTRRASSRKSIATTTVTSSSSRTSSRKDSAMADDASDQEDQEEVHMQADEEEVHLQAGGADEGEDVPASAAAPAAAATSTPAARRRLSRHSFGGGAMIDDELFGDDTPTRLTRLDEKSELQGLNKRLEFYILKQRERDASADAWGRELANLKNKHAADLEHQKKLFENQLMLVRKNRDDLSANLSKLEGENAHKDNLLTELTARVASEHKARSSLEARVDSLSKELMTAQSTIHALSTKLGNLQHEYDALKSSHDDLEAGLDASRSACDQAQTKANKLQQQYSDLSEEYDALQARHSADAKKYDLHVHELCQENQKSVESIRLDCEHRLNALFSERQFQNDKDKTDCLAELKHSYDTKLHGYRLRLEELGHELEQEKSAHRSAARGLEKELKYSEGLRSEVKMLHGRVASLEQALALEKENPALMKQLHEKNETIKRIKIAFKRKDAEFDELMDVKIMLDLEIKGYRSLLDQEDVRLGALHGKATASSYSSTSTTTTTSSSRSSKRGASAPKEEEDVAAAEQEDVVEDEPSSKKRRRNSTVPAAATTTTTTTSSRRKSTRQASASDFVPPPTKNGAVLFSRNDSTGQYVAMTNNSGQAATLTNWVLRVPRHDLAYTFPEVTLESGATFYVASRSPSASDVGAKDQVASWPREVVWSTDCEDSAELVTPSGVIVASVVIAPPTTAADMVDEAPQTTGHGRTNNSNQCAIM